MAWDDPSPRTRSSFASARPPAVPALQPGYGDAPVSFGRLMFRVVLAGALGVLAMLGTKAALAGWHGPGGHASGLALVLAVAVGFVVATLAWKYVMNRPTRHGLSARVRDGSWGGGPDGLLDTLVAVDVVTDLVEVAIDVAADL
jgi:hypothetical protein